MYVDTNSSVRSWQILYVNYVLQYVNGNAVVFFLFYFIFCFFYLFIFFFFKVSYLELWQFDQSLECLPLCQHISDISPDGQMDLFKF